MIDWDEHPNFSEHEFMCRCGCGRAEMDPSFVGWLQGLRDELGQPLTINSGFRCPPNDPSGRHGTGKVADIGISGEWAWVFVQLCIKAGVRSLGIRQHGPYGKRFIHADNSDFPSFLWTYDAPPVELTGQDV